MNVDGTIVAQASAQGEASQGVVRLSGENALKSAAAFFSPRNRAVECPLFQDFVNQSQLPTRPFAVPGFFRPWGDSTPTRQVRCVLFYWPEGRGFTGEQAVELHMPGAEPILNASIRTLCSTGIVRLAGRGEFTLRAFLNGRLDLTQAEAILGAIDAGTEGELRNALKQLSGSLSRKFNALRDRLLDVLSELEAGFDFTEEDIEFISSSQIHSSLVESLAEIEEALNATQTQLATDRASRVVLVGRPNVGKSSLFNKLVERFNGKATGKALVSGVAGTTRDYLEAELTVDEVRFTLVDSAGIESEILSEAAQKSLRPESETITARSPRELAQYALRQAVDQAALVVKCFDSPQSRSELLEEIAELKISSELEVLTKCDNQTYATDELLQSSRQAGNPQNAPLPTSSETETGIEELGKKIVQSLNADVEGGEMVSSTAVRCQEALLGARAALQNALRLQENESLCDESLLASELRLALNQIGLVTGQVHTDDLLDRIFSRFCIGK